MTNNCQAADVVSSVKLFFLKIGLELVPLSVHSFYNKIVFFFFFIVTPSVVSRRVTVLKVIFPLLNTRGQQATGCEQQLTSFEWLPTLDG